MGLSRTVSEIDGDISRKSQNFTSRAQNTPGAGLAHPRCILRPNEGVPLGFGYRRCVKKLERWVTGPRKKFYDIFSRMDTIHQRDRCTDGQRATVNTYRAYA